MEIRDKSGTLERYQELFNRNNKWIADCLSNIEKILESKKKGIQLHRIPNKAVLINNYGSISSSQLDNFVVGYSMGKSIKDIKDIYYSYISSLEQSEEADTYTDMIWALSIGIMFEIEYNEFVSLVNLIEKENTKDFLMDFLIHYRLSTWEMKANKFEFTRPYGATSEIVDLSKIDKVKGLERLKKYLSKEWYRGHSDATWYNLHKERIDLYVGYWSFESGALVKILGLDDSSLKDTPYYPYDLVHWKDEPSIPKR